FRQEVKVEENAVTHLDHLCRLNIRDAPQPYRKTGIICTIGPSCRSVEMLKQMITCGMNIARLNFSHGSHEVIRKCFSEYLTTLLTYIVLFDDFTSDVWNLALLTFHSFSCIYYPRTSSNFYVFRLLLEDFHFILKVVSKGSRVYIDDGLISLVVNEIKATDIECTIENGGMLGSRKGVNLPGTLVDLPAVSEKDISDLKFGVEQGVDMIFASFIRNADGIRTMRKVLGEKGNHIKIIAKIENQEGMDKADEIIAEADGVMVARGDLGIEIPTEKVFVAQKMLIAKCNKAGKPVVCATQMLESMTKKPRPTRAEGADVANAVLDGADCVMLSGETAKGDYPLETVKTMHYLCIEAEAASNHRRYVEDVLWHTNRPTDMTHTVVLAAITAAVKCHAAAIILVTSTGRVAMNCSRYKSPIPILAVCRHTSVCRQLNLCRAIFPIFYNKPKQNDFATDVDNRINHGIEIGKSRGYISKGDFLVVINGWKFGSGFTNTMRIIT
ncbi:hypothetical protein Angca_005300, partial [Angiostrongylus cantonensis]